MITQKIENQHWGHYFDHFSSLMGAQLMSLEIVGMSIGNQLAAENVAFSGISFDQKNNVISVQAESLGHTIEQPREVYVVEGDDGVESMEVVDVEENKHILSFKPA